MWTLITALPLLALSHNNHYKHNNNIQPTTIMRIQFAAPKKFGLHRSDDRSKKLTLIIQRPNQYWLGVGHQTLNKNNKVWHQKIVRRLVT